MSSDTGPIDRPILITGCDERYVPYADALIRSIRAQPKLDHLPIALVDYGLRTQTRKAFEDQGILIRDGDWALDFPARSHWEKDKPHLKAFTVKAFLPELFPDFDPLFWIDADAWLQTAEGVLGYLKALRSAPDATVLEWDCGYDRLLRENEIWDYHHSVLQTNFGSEVADRMHLRPVINAGVLALRRDAPLWRSWQENLARALRQPDRPHDQTYLFEQTSFNVAAYLDNRASAHLPAAYNWSLYHAVPAWCPERRLYAEPNPPHAPIHCLHMTGESKDRDHRVPVIGRPGKSFVTPFDYDSARRNAPEGLAESATSVPPATQNPIIVTACDEPYARLLRGLLRSLQQHRSLGQVPIGLIDLGLTAETRQSFEKAGLQVVPGRWDLDFPARATWERSHRGYMALTAKPYLPDYFPSHDAYLWIDADVWVQVPSGVTAFLDALRDVPAAVVLELDRSYHKYLTRPEIWAYHAGLVEENYGSEVASRMHLRPVINAGLFAFRRDAPHWDLWKRGIARALQAQKPPFEDNHYFDQVALNVAVYEGKLPTAFLPAPYNWTLIEARPRWCPKRRLYVEPSPPHDALRNLHLTGPTKIDAFKIRVLGSEASFDTRLDYDSALRNAPKVG